jgi:hypothetical protein
VLTGEAGAGKSRLAQDFVASLPEAWSARTVRITRTGVGLPELGRERPLAVILDDGQFLDPAASTRCPVASTSSRPNQCCVPAASLRPRSSTS